jgi:hypothetical protein
MTLGSVRRDDSLSRFTWQSSRHFAAPIDAGPRFSEFANVQEPHEYFYLLEQLACALKFSFG